MEENKKKKLDENQIEEVCGGKKKFWATNNRALR